MDEGVPFDAVLFDYLGPVQREVGSRWQQADYRIAEEHAASTTTETVIALLAGSFDMDEAAPHVVVACAQGDTHSLPARMVSAYLTYLGWRVTFLGATLPAADLGAFLADEQPRGPQSCRVRSPRTCGEPGRASAPLMVLVFRWWRGACVWSERSSGQRRLVPTFGSAIPPARRSAANLGAQPGGGRKGRVRQRRPRAVGAAPVRHRRGRR